MSIVESAKSLRKRLKVRKLRGKIPISEFEKAVIVGLREKERTRVTHRLKIHA